MKGLKVKLTLIGALPVEYIATNRIRKAHAGLCTLYKVNSTVKDNCQAPGVIKSADCQSHEYWMWLKKLTIGALKDFICSANLGCKCWILRIKYFHKFTAGAHLLYWPIDLVVVGSFPNWAHTTIPFHTIPYTTLLLALGLLVGFKSIIF